MKVSPLATNEIADNGSFTHIATITADDLTTAATNTAQTITLVSLMAGDIIGKILWRAKTFFQASADAAFNTTTMSIGDTASGVATHKAAIELNVNGTEVREGFSNTAVGPYTAADSLTATFNAMAAKALLSIDTGEVEILFQLIRPSVLEEAVSGKDIRTK